MLIDFNEIKEMTVPGINGGTGEMTARMYLGDGGKIIPCRIHAGGARGIQRQETSEYINNNISGNGEAICDGKEKKLTGGTCHICRKGSEHSIFNTGAEDLVMLTVVVER